jgi:hypothetical protein
MIRTKLSWKTGAAACVFLFCAVPVFAQEPTPQPPPPQPPVTDTKNQQNTDQSSNSAGDSSALDHPVAVTSTTPPVRQVSGAGFLGQSTSPLRWGPLYVSYIQFAEILSEGDSFNGQQNFANEASQISADIVLDKEFHNARIALQYVPRMTILNGQVLGDFVNQDTGADLVFAITPRLSLDVSDHFIYYRSKDSFADIFLSSDPVSGTTLQKDFIQTPASWLSNSVAAAFNYSLSARTRISISPNYTYATTSGAATATTFPSVNEYGLNANVTHDLTASSGVTANYSEQTDVLGGSSFKTIYQSFQGGYYHSFRGGWSLSGSFGLITANFQTGRNWSESGSGSVVKELRRSRASIAYYRGHSLSGYVSQGFSDRIDASYQLYAGRRWTMGGGLGYLRDVGTSNGIWGKYGEANVSFGLTSTFSLFGSYVYKWQAANNSLVFSGNTNYLRCGIQWTPRQPLVSR